MWILYSILCNSALEAVLYGDNNKKDICKWIYFRVVVNEYFPYLVFVYWVRVERLEP